jgi:hypothetical protein
MHPCSGIQATRKSSSAAPAEKGETDMKLIKTLSLTAVAVIASMAFLSASASANNGNIVLCKKAELNCTDPFPNPTTIVGHATSPLILTNFGILLCKESLVEVQVLNVLAASIVGHVTSLTFTSPCMLGPFNCPVVSTQTLGLLTGTITGALQASLVSNGGTTIFAECAAGSMKCTFGGTPTLTGASSGAGVTTVTADEDELTRTGTKCPTTALWDVVYTMLGAMWIES